MLWPFANNVAVKSICTLFLERSEHWIPPLVPHSTCEPWWCWCHGLSLFCFIYRATISDEAMNYTSKWVRVVTKVLKCWPRKALSAQFETHYTVQAPVHLPNSMGKCQSTYQWTESWRNCHVVEYQETKQMSLNYFRLMSRAGNNYLLNLI